MAAPDRNSLLLVPPPRDHRSSHVRVGLRRTLLAPSDMVVPLICGVLHHLFYITLLGPILFLYFNDYNNVQQCTDAHFEIYLIAALLIHVLTLTTNVLSTVIAYKTKVLRTSKWLDVLLSIRLFLNVFEILVIIYGFIVIFIMQQNKSCFIEHDILYVLIAINLLSNLSLILLTWLVLFCCCTKPQNVNSEYVMESQQTYSSFLHKYCQLCFYDQKSPKLAQTFDEMGGLITILLRGNPYDDLELTPSDIVTGLHLLRMLQKHYGLFDEKFYFPFNQSHSLSDNKKEDKKGNRLKELEYYTLYTNAAYGVGLFALSKPCAICCAPPCSLPHNLQDDILQRNDKCCCNEIQIDNSNLKVFIERTGVSVADLLLCCQIGDLNKVNFYVNIDRKQHALVISLRGTMSIQDSITDIACQPMHFPEIDDDCYVHRGIGECAKYVFDTITQNRTILDFLSNHPNHDIVVCGHSLGAGVCVILSLMLKYGAANDQNHLNLFVNQQRKLKAFAIAPPPVIERQFALRINEQTSEFLTCIIYRYDIIPRLSFTGVAFTRSAINRLLLECIQTPWWIYEKSLHMTRNTVADALKHDSKYINNYVVVRQEDEKEDAKEEKDSNIMPGYDYFVNDIMKDIKHMEEISVEHELSAPEIWNTRFCQMGYVLHAVTKDELSMAREPMRQTRARGIFAVLCNVLNCMRCLDAEDTKYEIYHANPDAFCDKLLISPYLLRDHMPQVYLNVLQNICAPQSI